MKNIASLIVVMATLLTGINVFAGSPAHPIKPVKKPAATTHAFSVDETQANAALSELDALEQHVLNNSGTTLEDVQATRPDLTEHLQLSETASVLSPNNTNTSIAGIPPFFWGFLLSFIGVLIVHFTNRDVLDTQMAIYGALTALGMVIFYFILRYFSPIFGSDTL